MEVGKGGESFEQSGLPTDVAEVSTTDVAEASPIHVDEVESEDPKEAEDLLDRQAKMEGQERMAVMDNPEGTDSQVKKGVLEVGVQQGRRAIAEKLAPQGKRPPLEKLGQLDQKELLENQQKCFPRKIASGAHGFHGAIALRLAAKLLDRSAVSGRSLSIRKMEAVLALGSRSPCRIVEKKHARQRRQQPQQRKKRRKRSRVRKSAMPVHRSRCCWVQ